MKVYLAMRGDGYESSVLRVFAHKKDADAHPMANFVEEMDVTEGQADVRQWHTLTWNLRENSEPYVRAAWTEFDDGDPGRVTHFTRVNFKNPYRYWTDTKIRHRPVEMIVGGWNLDAVHRVFAEQREAFLREREEEAAAVLATLDRIDVQANYDVGEGRVLLTTPIHPGGAHFTVSRVRILQQAGLPADIRLGGRWFTVQTLTPTDADGFTVCADPHEKTLAIQHYS